MNNKLTDLTPDCASASASVLLIGCRIGLQAFDNASSIIIIIVVAIKQN